MMVLVHREGVPAFMSDLVVLPAARVLVAQEVDGLWLGVVMSQVVRETASRVGRAVIAGRSCVVEQAFLYPDTDYEWSFVRWEAAPAVPDGTVLCPGCPGCSPI
jgi:hypothetical protein